MEIIYGIPKRFKEGEIMVRCPFCEGDDCEKVELYSEDISWAVCRSCGEIFDYETTSNRGMVDELG